MIITNLLNKDDNDDDNHKYEGSAELASTHRPGWTVAIVKVGVPVIIIIIIITIVIVVIIVIIIVIVIIVFNSKYEKNTYLVQSSNPGQCSSRSQHGREHISTDN